MRSLLAEQVPAAVEVNHVRASYADDRLGPKRATSLTSAKAGHFHSTTEKCHTYTRPSLPRICDGIIEIGVWPVSGKIPESKQCLGPFRATVASLLLNFCTLASTTRPFSDHSFGAGDRTLELATCVGQTCTCRGGLSSGCSKAVPRNATPSVKPHVIRFPPRRQDIRSDQDQPAHLSPPGLPRRLEYLK